MIWMWIGFVLLVLLMLAVDLGVFHRKAHAISLREALGWSAVWIVLALCFNVFIYFAYDGHWLGLGRGPDGTVALDPIDRTVMNGHNAAIKFFTGYVVEKSLSMDNIFVMAIIFAYFAIPNQYQHRVLFWGIMGALVMRGVFIVLGAALIARFHWILYIFGAFLIYTAFKMGLAAEEPDPSRNVFIRWARKLFPITPELHGQRFFIRREQARLGACPDLAAELAPADSGLRARSRYVLTPLALCLIVVEGTDLIFAVDSIPAIFAITGDPFLVFTSNVFAILGLRALYFVLAGMLGMFRFLRFALAVVLGLVGVKMLVADWLKHFEFWANNLSFVTLALIATSLAVGVIASLLWPEKPEHRPERP